MQFYIKEKKITQENVNRLIFTSYTECSQMCFYMKLQLQFRLLILVV